MPERAYPNAICAEGHIEVDHERECVRCDKRLTAKDKVAVHVTRTRPREQHTANPEDLASVEDWGHADTGERP